MTLTSVSLLLKNDQNPFASDEEGIKELYFKLAQGKIDSSVLINASSFLQKQLEEVRHCQNAFPIHAEQLQPWLEQKNNQVKQEYAEYLQKRKSGAPRQYFSNKSHALYFLGGIAPTKLVDGAWLYGVLKGWQDVRFAALIKIYLDEIGMGVADKNHVLIYKKLLLTHHCERCDQLDDRYFLQGLIQLGLAYHADDYLPEIIGFNLGYEQLPLHILITAYELSELGIDSTYFKLHLTLDNAATGHAYQSAKALFELAPVEQNADLFYERVRQGYLLSSRGLLSTQIIDSFELEQEVFALLKIKSKTGFGLHSDYSKVGGKTVNEWLSNPENIPEFLKNLEKEGWIVRNQDPKQSRFWNLIDGARGPMCGVFTSYEKQLISDWISGGAAHSDPSQQSNSPKAVDQEVMEKVKKFKDQSPQVCEPENISNGAVNEFNREMNILKEDLLASKDKGALMNQLIDRLAPSRHHQPAGLAAAAIF